MQDMTEYLIKFKKETSELNRAKGEVDSLTEKIKNQKVDYTKLDKEQKKTYDSIVKGSKKATDSNVDLMGKVKGIAGAYIGFQTIKNSFNVFSQFDDKLKKTQALTGATTAEMNAMSKQAKDLGASTAFSASQVAEAQSNMGQVGMKTNEILAATPGILSFASAAQMDMATATTAVTDTMSIFGLAATDSTRIADIFATASSKSARGAEWFSSALANSGANARSLGFSLEDTTAVLATMAPAFKDGGSAGTALNAIMRDLTKNMDKQGKITIAGQKVEVARNGRMLKFSEIIANTNKATQSLTEVQQKQALATVMGDEAIRGFNGLLASGADKISEYDNHMKNSTDSAMTMAKIMESGPGGAMRNLSSAFEGATIALAEALLPAFMKVIDVATTMTTGVKGILDLYKEYPSIMWTITAACGAYVGVQKSIVAWNTIMNASNPWGWLKIAITAVTAALIYFEGKYQSVSKMVDKTAKFFGITPKSEKDTATGNVTPVKVPAFAKGTNNAPGGISLVGEQGPELVNLRKGSQVIPSEKTRQMLGKSISIGGDKVEINISSITGNSAEIIEEIKEYLDKRERRRSSQIMQMLGGA
ncbi:MAG: phage tail tape measure protein [Paraclostridium sp.]